MNNFFGLLKIAMRRAGALALATVLALLLGAPAVRADTLYAVTGQFEGACLPIFASAFAMTIPGIGLDNNPFDDDFNGLMTFTFDTGPNTLQENSAGGTANFSALMRDPSSIPFVDLKVNVRMSGKRSCVVPEIIDPQTCEIPSTYGCFSSWSGTLEVVNAPDPANIGAVYSLTGTDEFIFGDGAFIFSTKLGARGEFSAQLDDPASFPGLPAGPLPGGDLRFVFVTATSVQAGADTSVIGTWEGTLDCIGHAGQGEVFSTTDTSTDATLLISGGGAELIKGVGLDAEPNGNSYCVNITASADGSTSEGLLASPETFDPQGFVKVDGDTLKLRLLHSEGIGVMDNVSFCKAEFNRTDPANPGVVVAGSCSTRGAFLDSAAARQEFCDTVVCGPGTICENTITVADGTPFVCDF